MDMTRNMNRALDKVVALIFRSDQKWQWDDANNSDLPIATTSLVSGQSDYSMPVTHLKVLKVRIKDSAGNWISLNPVDSRDLRDSDRTASSATPTKYDKVGSSIFLYPAPNYASSGGLEVQHQRGASYFTTSDTTKAPGFASVYHRLVSMYAALDFCSVNDMPQRVAALESAIAKMEADLVSFYSSRNVDEKQSLKLQHEDYSTGRGFDDDGGFRRQKQDGFIF